MLSKRAQRIHAENRARILRERERMAVSWDTGLSPVVPDPEQALAAIFAALGRDYAGSLGPGAQP